MYHASNFFAQLLLQYTATTEIYTNTESSAASDVYKRQLKHGITVLNTPGTIDADYRGEIMVLLINFSQQDFVINDGERIAQMVLAKHEQCDFIEVEELDETERGAGGYGHTGVK